MNADAKRALLAVAATLVIFGLMYMAIQEVSPWKEEQDNLGDGDAQLDAAVSGIFGRHVVAFEVLGILLTAAMIGALVVARPLGVKDDRENYSHPTKAQVRESTTQSDVRTHFPGGPQ